MRAIIILIMLSTYTLFGVDAGDNPMPDKKEINAAKAIKTRHEQKLMAIPGVVSVGIGKNQGSMVITVGVEEFITGALSNIPKTLDGYPVVVQEVGKPKIQGDNQGG